MGDSETAVLFGEAQLDELCSRARASPRLRMNQNFHGMDDPVHRLLNAIEPGSYVRPHRHLDPSKTETILMVRGALGLIVFDKMGVLREATRLEVHGGASGADLPVGVWHTLVSLEPGTVFFETKPGPYVSPKAGDVAAWAPAEGEPASRLLEERWRALFMRAI
jgi:cupin fold WbuC family metalloprotein